MFGECFFYGKLPGFGGAQVLDGCSQVKMITWIHHCPEDTHSWTTTTHSWTTILGHHSRPKSHTGNCKRTLYLQPTMLHNEWTKTSVDSCGLYSYINLRSYSLKAGRESWKGIVFNMEYNTHKDWHKPFKYFESMSACHHFNVRSEMFIVQHWFVFLAS